MRTWFWAINGSENSTIARAVRQRRTSCIVIGRSSQKNRLLRARAAGAGQLDELLAALPPAHPVGERLPLGVEERTPVLASAVVEVAAPFGQERVQEQLARREIVGNDARLHDPEVHAGLLLVPGGGAGRERLQAHRRALAVARDAPCVPLALGEEDRLNPGPEVLEVESRGCWSAGRLRARHRGCRVLGEQRSQEQNEQGDAHDAPPPYQQAGLNGAAYHALLLARGRGQPLVDELLHAISLRLAGHDVAFRIDAQAVQVKELTRLPAGPADLAELLERPPIENRDALVGPVRDVQEPLLRIGGEADAERAAGALRLAFHEPFFQEHAVDGERLNPVVGAVRDVDDAVVRDRHAVGRVELLGGLAGGLAPVRRLVVRLLAVGTPVALVRAGVGVENDDATIAVAVGDEDFVRLRVHGDGGRPAQVFGAVAVDGDAALADLQQELSVARELQDLAVAGAVAGQPHFGLVVDRDAVLAAAGAPIAVGAMLPAARGALRERGKEAAAIEPLVARVMGRAAPSLDVLAGLAELHHRRSRRVPVLGGVAFLERVRPVEDPDVAVRVGRRAANAAQEHAIRHRGKVCVDLEDRHGHLRTGLLILRRGARRPVRTAGDDQQRQRYQRRARDERLSHASTLRTG